MYFNLYINQEFVYFLLEYVTWGAHVYQEPIVSEFTNIINNGCCVFAMVI